jgi:NADH-quinone oxidoreductase subunit L
MVTAGVYLMARVSPIIFTSHTELATTIAWIGALTALLAATIACAQDDIKRVLAYSTISQLGYMFLAVGSGSYVAAIFHMITHAFFKALLFLGAGSVIHGMHDEQNMKRMGRLRKYMPVTAYTFIVGWLAIAGIPPLSGFWSKDDILAAAFHFNKALYVIGAFTAGLTAYYMTRQVSLTFYGKERWREDGKDEAEHGGHATEPHEAPWTMALPLGVLAFLAAVGGLINLPFGKWNFLERWLAPVVEQFSAVGGVSSNGKVFLAVVTTFLCILGIGVGWRVWTRSAENPQLEPVVLREGWYINDLYSLVFGEGGSRVAGLSAAFDKYVIDGAVNGVAGAVRTGGTQLRKLQTGYVRNYALGLAAGTVALLTYVFIVARVTG